MNYVCCGCNDVVIEGNRVTNSSGIYMRSDQWANEGRFNLLWNSSIVGNEIRMTKGKRAVSFYSLQPVQPKQLLLSTGTFGLEIRLVQAKFTNLGSSVPGEGSLSEVKSSTLALLNNSIGILGTIYERNTAINCDFGYHLSQSMSQTIIKYMNVGFKYLMNETLLPEAAKIGKVIILEKDSINEK